MAPRCCRGLDRVGLPDELPRPFASRVNNRAGAAWRLPQMVSVVANSGWTVPLAHRNRPWHNTLDLTFQLSMLCRLFRCAWDCDGWREQTFRGAPSREVQCLKSHVHTDFRPHQPDGTPRPCLKRG